MKKYEIGKNDDYLRFNIWYRKCQEKNTPYIVIKKRMKYASIDWDYFSFDKDIDSILSNNEVQLKKQFLELFTKYSNDKSNYTISCFLACFDNILIENSENLAEELYDIIANVVLE